MELVTTSSDVRPEGGDVSRFLVDPPRPSGRSSLDILLIDSTSAVRYEYRSPLNLLKLGKDGPLKGSAEAAVKDNRTRAQNNQSGWSRHFRADPAKTSSSGA